MATAVHSFAGLSQNSAEDKRMEKIGERRKSMEMIINIWKQFLFANRKDRFMRLNSPSFRKQKADFEHKRLEENRLKQRIELQNKHKQELMRKKMTGKESLKAAFRQYKPQPKNLKPAMNEDDIIQILLTNKNDVAAVDKKTKQEEEQDTTKQKQSGLSRYFNKNIDEQTLA